MAKKDVEKSAAKSSLAPQSGWWSQHPLIELRRQMETLFDDFATGFDRPSWWTSRETSPLTGFGPADVRVEVNEDDKAYEIVAELPGLDDKDVDVELSNGTLTIKGEKTSEQEEKKKNCYFSERSYGSFQRSFQVPEDVEADKISADFAKGVLTVTLPKAPEAQSPAKKISVKAK